ncbi:hypothetical protein LCGC14_1563280 [marine sediment metagenome]|uniref:Uncharacterized protein n=1 Tax=marine sediment metagenome TaxID=412755 RepID=A0A0F9ILV3_9ZZZZ
MSPSHVNSGIYQIKNKLNNNIYIDVVNKIEEIQNNIK